MSGVAQLTCRALHVQQARRTWVPAGAPTQVAHTAGRSRKLPCFMPKQLSFLGRRAAHPPSSCLESGRTAVAAADSCSPAGQSDGGG